MASSTRRGPQKALSPAQEAEVVKLLAQGWTQTALARRFAVGQSTVARTVQRHEASAGPTMRRKRLDPRSSIKRPAPSSAPLGASPAKPAAEQRADVLDELADELNARFAALDDDPEGAVAVVTAVVELAEQARSTLCLKLVARRVEVPSALRRCGATEGAT